MTGDRIDGDGVVDDDGADTATATGAGYRTRIIELRLGGLDYRIRALADRQQFADPQGRAERAGICSAQWSVFGQIWPAGRILAGAMARFEIAGKRILELGCGLGLSSLVLQRREADITASDHHPLAADFLRGNAALNGLPPIAYRQLAWADDGAVLGRFDVIIGSDVLYETGHVALLAGMLDRRALDAAHIVIADPGRGFGNPLSHALRRQDYRVEEVRCAFADTDRAPFRGRLLHYRR